MTKETENKLVVALRFAKEIIDDQAERFHQGCRCQLCESGPMLINDALEAYAKESE